ncbi:hypothetical protein GE09DRAFT_1100255 [Coniochaeta sp. 2T2.1]|nr:hypothetical protein GE09DRAFT_1100255 [Coniochaeta sp. 2T2.1]
MDRLSTIPITLDPSIYRPQAPMMERRRLRSITLAPSVFEPPKRSVTDEYPSRRSKNLPPLPKSPWPIPPSQTEDDGRLRRQRSDDKRAVHIQHAASRTHSEPPSRQGSSHTLQASQPERRAHSNPPSLQGIIDTPPPLRRAVILERAPLRRPSVPSPKPEPTPPPPPSSPPSRSSTLVGEGDALPPFNPHSRSNNLQTRYMAMLLSLDKIPRLHNILAAFFGWILLAGFIVLPGTFTSNDNAVQRATPGANDVLNTVVQSSLPLSVVAAVCCGIGYLGNLWLSIRWRNNYVWLINRVYIPGTLNALAGLISALTIVYSQHKGTWSVSAKVAVVVESTTCVFYLVLFLLYNNWLLEKVREQHGQEELGVGFGSKFKGKVERMARQRAVAPGSIV